MTETEARNQNLQIIIGKFPYQANSRSRLANFSSGFVKFICSEKGDIYGMTIIGPNASEAILEGVIAIQNGLSIESIAHTIHPHPSFSESIMEAAKIVLQEQTNF